MMLVIGLQSPQWLYGPAIRLQSFAKSVRQNAFTYGGVEFAKSKSINC